MIQDSSRRIFLKLVPTAVVGLWAFKTLAQEPPPPKRPAPIGGPGPGSSSTGGPKPSSSNPPLNPVLPKNDPDGVLPEVPKADPKMLKQNESGIKRDIEKLAELAQELKKQVETTDSTKVLSIDMLKKTQEIEKLAHQIATLAKG
jgi:ABC-type transporter Mla subunit MlaD